VGLGLASRDPVVTPSGSVAPRDVLAAVLAPMAIAAGEPSDREVIDVRVAGTRDGAGSVVRSLADLRPSPEGLSAGAFGTAIPIAVAARWLAEGRVAPGVHPPETAFDAEAFVGDLAREGVGFSSEILA
jgi:saccharopine dehydrogenase-like NADP-dependent oxidoreductase